MEGKYLSIVALHQAGKKSLETFEDLKSTGVSLRMVYRKVKRFIESGCTKMRYNSGRKRTVRVAWNSRMLRSRLKRNPRQNARSLAKKTGNSKPSISRILKKDLRCKPYKIQKIHDLMTTQKKNRLLRSKALLQRIASGELQNIVFSGEKVFTVQQILNKRNDRLWASVSFIMITK